MKPCQSCGNPLPDGSAPQRKFCDDCKLTRNREAQRKRRTKDQGKPCTASCPTEGWCSRHHRRNRRPKPAHDTGPAGWTRERWTRLPSNPAPRYAPAPDDFVKADGSILYSDTRSRLTLAQRRWLDAMDRALPMSGPDVEDQNVDTDVDFPTDNVVEIEFQVIDDLENIDDLVDELELVA